MKKIAAIMGCIMIMSVLYGCVGESGDVPASTSTQAAQGTQPPLTPVDTDEPTPSETHLLELEDMDAQAVNRMFGPISHYLNDGGSLEIFNFEASQKQDAEYYQGVVYFYLCAIEGMTGEAISPNMTDSSYRLTEDEAKLLFASYFGEEFIGDFEELFKDKLDEDGEYYEFDKSDGPSYTAVSVSQETSGDGMLRIDVDTIMDSEGGEANAGIFEAVLKEDSNSIFGYSLHTYEFTPHDPDIDTPGGADSSASPSSSASPGSSDEPSGTPGGSSTPGNGTPKPTTTPKASSSPTSSASPSGSSTPTGSARPSSSPDDA